MSKILKTREEELWLILRDAGVDEKNIEWIKNHYKETIKQILEQDIKELEGMKKEKTLVPVSPVHHLQYAWDIPYNRAVDDLIEKKQQQLKELE